MESHITENNCSDEMTACITQIVSNAYAKHKSLQNFARFGENPDLKFIFNTRGIMDDVALKVSYKYQNIPWHCLAGPNVKYEKEPRPKHFIRYDIDRTTPTDAVAGKKDFCRVILWSH